MRTSRMVALLAGYTGWPLEYIGQLTYSQLVYLVYELNYQRQVEQYRLEVLLGQLVAMWVKGSHTAKQIAGDEPKYQEVTITMTVKKQPQKAVLGDGNEYTLPVIDANIMELVEEEFDKEWDEIFKKMRAKHIKSLVYHMLHRQNPNITLEEVGALLTVEAITNVSKVIPKLL